MNKKQFVHLHVHNHYSLLDGMGTPKDYIHKAMTLGMPALATTNHGTCGGFYGFYNDCISAKIKPILGVEVYICDDMTIKSKEGKQKNFHLTLLAKNINGVRNIQKLVTEANINGFYYKPRIDIKCLIKYSQDVICMGACTSGYIANLTFNDELGTVAERDVMIADRIKEMKTIFGRDFFFEVMPNEMNDQSKVNYELINLSQKYNIPIVATNDCHYVEWDDRVAHNTLLMIQSKSTVTKPKWSFEAQKLYLMDYDEMMTEFKVNHRYIKTKDAEQYLDTSLDIVSRIDIQMDFSKYVLPKFDIPREYPDEEKYIRSLMNTRWKEKNITAYPNKDLYKQRAEYELSIIKSKGLINYFLIVQDFIKWANNAGIYTGPGRGSAAGSLVSYLLGITEVDPIKFNLLFERFVNPERLNMPDIDSDFEHERREEVKQYIINKYGANNVAGIGTYSTMNPNMCFRDVCRAYEIPYLTINSLAKTFKLKDDDGNEASMEYNVQHNEKLKKFAEKHPELMKVISRLQGQYRHCSVAAGGILITDIDITNYMALRHTKDATVTEWDKYDIEGAKLLKMDILGIKTLSIMRNTLEKVGKDLKWLYTVPLNDKAVLAEFVKGNTESVFQFESDGMTNIMKKFASVTFEDLVAVNALYRPGSIEFIDLYINRKYGREPITYAFEEAQKHLQNTYGLCLYQEQLMYIASEAGGLTLGEADIVRKCKEKVTDENKKKIQFYKDKILQIKGPGEKTNKVLAFIDGVGGYSFNRSHSVCYALLGYYTMYLKVHYPHEFSLAVLNNAIGDIDDTRTYLSMARKLGVKVLPVNINTSHADYRFDNNKNIIKGFVSVKGVGEKAANHIVEKRPFKDFKDFMSKISKQTCNKKVTGTLMGIGAFDSIQQYKSVKQEAIVALKLKPEEVFPRYFYELKHLGVFETKSPLEEFKAMYDKDLIKSLTKIDSMEKKKEIALAGIVMELEEFHNYKNEKTGIMKVSDGKFEDKFILDASQYGKYKEKLIPGRIILFVAEKMRHRGKSKDPIMEINSIVKIFVDKKGINLYNKDRGH